MLWISHHVASMNIHMYVGGRDSGVGKGCLALRVLTAKGKNFGVAIPCIIDVWLPKVSIQT